MTDESDEETLVCGVCGYELEDEYNMGCCSCDKCSCLCQKCGTWSDVTEEWYCGGKGCIAPDEDD